MRQNAISAGLITLLLSIVAILWIPQTPHARDVAGGIVANGNRPATVHTAAVNVSATRALRVASALKRRRSNLVAAVVAPPPAPEQETYVAAVDLPTIKDNHKRIATKVLNALPLCRDHLVNFSVLYQGATRRGLGGKTTIILDGSVPDDEFAALLVHECGHVISANMSGTADAGDSGYRDGSVQYYQNSPMVAYWSTGWNPSGTRKSGMSDRDYASGYAKSDQYEDFAEALALYVLQRDAFIARAKQSSVMAAKLSWMETNIPIAAETLGDGSDTGAGGVPWDVTKLSFTLAR